MAAPLAEYGITLDRVKAGAALATVILLAVAGLPTTVPLVAVLAVAYGGLLAALVIDPRQVRIHLATAAVGAMFWAGYAAALLLNGHVTAPAVVPVLVAVLVVANHLAAIRRLIYFEELCTRRL